MKIDTIAKRIILEELEENTHPENVEDVIFWALEHYSKSEPARTWGRVIAYAIKERILSEELKEENNRKQDTPKKSVFPEINYCDECKVELAICTGYVNLQSDSEPFDSGRDDFVNMDKEVRIMAYICPECNKIKSDINEI